jgi:hypothetical protein
MMRMYLLPFVVGGFDCVVPPDVGSNGSDRKGLVLDRLFWRQENFVEIGQSGASHGQHMSRNPVMSVVYDGFGGSSGRMK